MGTESRSSLLNVVAAVRVVSLCGMLVWTTAQVAAPPGNPVVAGGNGTMTVDKALTALKKGTAVPAGAEVTTGSEALDLVMPDGTKLAINPNSTLTFNGRSGGGQTDFSLHIDSGQINLDTRTRTSKNAITYVMRTRIHTIVTFKATQGSVIVNEDHDRVACLTCAVGDFIVRSYDREAKLKPREVATVTQKGGVVVAMQPQSRHSDVVVQDWSFNWANWANSQSSLTISAVSMQVRAGGGDRSSLAVCPDRAFDLAAAGGSPPYSVERVDTSPYLLKYKHNFSATVAYIDQSDFLVKATRPGNTVLRLSDTEGRSAALSVYVLSATSKACKVPPFVQIIP